MGGGVVSWSNTTNFAAAVKTAGSALISGNAVTVATNYVSVPACVGTSYDSDVTTCTFGNDNSEIDKTDSGDTAAQSTVTYSWY